MDAVERSPDSVAFELGDSVPPMRRARRWITENAPDLDRAKLLDLLLVADALLTNAFEHARAPRRLRLSRPSGGRVVRVEVEDASPQLLPVLGRLCGGGLRNHGLLIVNRLASRWGVEPHARYKTVWGEVAG